MYIATAYAEFAYQISAYEFVLCSRNHTNTTALRSAVREGQFALIKDQERVVILTLDRSTER